MRRSRLRDHHPRYDHQTQKGIQLRTRIRLSPDGEIRASQAGLCGRNKDHSSPFPHEPAYFRSGMHTVTDGSAVNMERYCTILSSYIAIPPTYFPRNNQPNDPLAFNYLSLSIMPRLLAFFVLTNLVNLGCASELFSYFRSRSSSSEPYTIESAKPGNIKKPLNAGIVSNRPRTHGSDDLSELLDKYDKSRSARSSTASTDKNS